MKLRFLSMMLVLTLAGGPLATSSLAGPKAPDPIRTLSESDCQDTEVTVCPPYAVIFSLSYCGPRGPGGTCCTYKEYKYKCYPEDDVRTIRHWYPGGAGYVCYTDSYGTRCADPATIPET